MFRTTHWSHLQGSTIQKKAFCPNTEFIYGRVWEMKSLSSVVSASRVEKVAGREGSVVVSAAYSIKQTQEALNPEVRTCKPKEKPTLVTLLPYVHTAYI
jgi:hypothetical protein